MKPSYGKILAVVALTIVSVAPTFATNANGSDGATTGSKVENTGLKAGEAFTKARSRIVKLGWKPVRMHRNDNYEYDGAEKKLANRGFVEVDSCSIDAGVLCIFYYSKASECLRVDTRGEQIKYMSVTRWTNECPESL
jgi:hypothetical protein